MSDVTKEMKESGMEILIEKNSLEESLHVTEIYTVMKNLEPIPWPWVKLSEYDLKSKKKHYFIESSEEEEDGIELYIGSYDNNSDHWYLFGDKATINMSNKFFQKSHRSYMFFMPIPGL